MTKRVHVEIIGKIHKQKETHVKQKGRRWQWTNVWLSWRHIQIRIGHLAEINDIQWWTVEIGDWFIHHPLIPFLRSGWKSFKKKGFEGKRSKQNRSRRIWWLSCFIKTSLMPPTTPTPASSTCAALCRCSNSEWLSLSDHDYIYIWLILAPPGSLTGNDLALSTG